MACRCGFGGIGTRRCGWVITKDYVVSRDDPGYAVGKHGPRDTAYEPEYIRGHGKRFRMLDDDGQVYYHGVLFGDQCSGFEPLDHFGAPNAGCTTIQYMENGAWETL